MEAIASAYTFLARTTRFPSVLTVRDHQRPTCEFDRFGADSCPSVYRRRKGESCRKEVTTSWKGAIVVQFTPMRALTL